MKTSIFFYKELTKAEVGNTGTHEVYIRFPNDFDYKSFFHNSDVENGSVIEVVFSAEDTSCNKIDSDLKLRFVYFVNSNKEKRVPSLRTLFDSHNVEEGDIVCLESRNTDGIISYHISFYKKGEISISPNCICYSTLDIDNKIKVPTSLPTQPLQQIFYGAPGTGKSYKINEVTKRYGRDHVFRTTFHPDSDYSTFVGAYKPMMVRETRYGQDGSNTTVMRYPEGELKGQPIKESKIEYRFVKQAFMKAYVKAWKTFVKDSDVSLTSIAPSTVALSYGNQTWILTEVAENRILYTKEEHVSLEKYEKDVLKYWPTMPEHLREDGKYDLGTFDHYQAAACVWYKNQHGEEHSAEECWNAVLGILKGGGTIESMPNSQTYSISLKNGEIIAITRDNVATKKTIRGCFDNADSDSSVQKRIAKELKNYDASDFDHAWEILSNKVNGVEVPVSTDSTEVTPVFLIIEEINRGNCAQIFGDLFQLLDREEGFSQYPILADEDIRRCLLSPDTTEDPSFGVNGLSFNEEQAMLINSALKCENGDVASKIAKGEVLVLPPNLYIWATMNTSDQSLFPIDSAFKRRWEWKYVKITDAKENYKIKLNDDTQRDWWEFVQKVNRIIASMTSSADKQLGYFFCKADANKEISADKFVSKVLFYLWNDVFKDYGFEDASLFRYADDKDPNKTYELTFPDFYDEDGLTVNVVRVKDFIDKVLAWDDNQQQG